MTLSETIKAKTLELIKEKDAIVLGQCLTAVGWVGGTIPELPNHKNIIELSMADVAGGGIAVGAALDNQKPVIYVVRYQGFLWYNAISIANYAAKSFELFQVPCPLIVRAIGMEGSIGPVAGNYHLSLLLRMPGINIFAPMTSEEWLKALDFHFREFTKPIVLGEHRLSFHKDYDLKDKYEVGGQITMLAIGSARIAAAETYEKLRIFGVHVHLFNLYQLSPLAFPDNFLESLNKTKKCLIVDSDYVDWGQAESLGFKISKAVPNAEIEVIGLAKKSAGFSKETDNLPPNSEEIFKKVIEMINKI